MEEESSSIEKIKTSFKSIQWVNILLLIATTFFTMFTSSFYDNWGSLSTFFLSGDIYSNYCKQEQLKGPPLPGGRCNKQEYMISNLLPITRFTHYLSSAIAGIILDKYGHFITATIGMTCAFICWLLLGLFSHINFFSVLSCILMGMSVDSTAFPALMIKQRFPNSRNIVMTIIGSASSVSSAIPIIFNTLLDKTDASFKGISLTYCFVFIVTTWICMSIIHLKFIGSTQSLDEIESNDVVDAPPISLWDCLKTLKFISISFFFIVTNLTLTYHQYFLNIEYKNNLIIPKFLEILFVVSFIPCIIFGIIIEKYGTHNVLPLLNLFGLLSPIFALHTNTVNGILMSICIMMIYSVFASAVFCYVQHAFPKHKFGAISGIVSTIGGIAAMACMPLFELCNKYGINYQVNIFMIILRLVTFAPLWYIYINDHTCKQ